MTSVTVLRPKVEPAGSRPTHRCSAVVVDPRPVVRVGLAGIAADCVEGRVCAATNLDEASDRGCSPEKAVILGLSADHPPGELVARARSLMSAAVVVCALFCDDNALIADALDANADGYLAIDLTDHEAVAETLATVATGERAVPLELDRCSRRRRQGGSVLTNRCIEVLRLLAQGLQDAEIGEQLGMSTSSVRKHIRSAELRLRARTRAQAVALAARAEIL